MRWPAILLFAAAAPVTARTDCFGSIMSISANYIT
jgi:hypothetical protein